MAELLVIGYPDDETANQALDTVHRVRQRAMSVRRGTIAQVPRLAMKVPERGALGRDGAGSGDGFVQRRETIG